MPKPEVKKVGINTLFMVKTITRICCVIIMMLVSDESFAQALTGAKYIPGDYATITAAVSDLNSNGVGTGGVTFNVVAGYTQTLTAPVAVTATGTSANPIVFQKDPATTGANPLLTAYTGTATPGSATPDGMWRLMGSDYVTINGIDLKDNATTNPGTMEYGYGLFKASASDGAQNNTIKNCTITLSTANNATGTSPMLNGSVGILMINSTAIAATTSLTPTGSAGANSNNTITANTVKNANIGIGLVGYGTTGSTSLSDVNNAVGGTSAALGNSVLNYGALTSTANAAAGISISNQYSFVVSNNTVNNNNGSGTNHGTTLRGIYLINSTNASGDVNNNTVTISGGANSASYALDIEAGGSGTSNTINVINNTVTNCTNSAATSAAFYCLYIAASATTINANNNTVTNNSLPGTGALYAFYNSSTVTTLNANNNTVTGNTKTSTGSLYLFYLSGSNTTTNASGNYIGNNVRSLSTSGTTYCTYIGSPTTINFLNNKIEGNNYMASGSTGSIYGYYSPSSALKEVVWNDTIRNQNTPSSGTMYGIYIGSATGNKSIKNNALYGNRTSSGTCYGIYLGYGNVDTVAGNSIYSDTVSTGSSSLYGIYIGAGTTNAVFQNKIYDLSVGGTSPALYGIYLNGGTTNNIYNNIIGDLRTPASTALNGLNGINVSSGANNLYNNTVYLNAVSTGATFGTSAVFASTSATLTMINNILKNTSTAAGTGGYTVAYRRSGTTLSSYSTTSNNNLFYAGTPGSANLIFSDGTNNLQTLANYQALSGLSPRDNASVTENVTFLSTTGSSTNFLHIDPTVTSVTESGGQVISIVNTDFDGETRAGFPGYTGTGLAPDLGADEFAGTNPSICSGTPYVPTLSASSSTVCASTPFSLSITNVPGGIGYRYQFQSAPTGTTAWTNVGSSTSNASITIAGQTAAMDYRVIDSCISGGAYSTSSAITVNMSPSYLCVTYCTSNATSTADEDIFNVTLKNINNTSTCTTTGGTGSIQSEYSNYKSLTPANLTKLDPDTISVQIGTCGGNYGNATAVYIDLNQDGDFVDAGEQVYLSGASTTGPHTETGYFTIPLSATTGITTMRVVTVETTPASITPCGTYSWGETEDYLVNVLPPSPCITPVPGNTIASNANICAGTSTTLSIQNATSGVTVTYQWDSSINGTTYYAVAGATSPTYVAYPPTTTYYRVNVTCSTGPTTVTSNPVTVNVINCNFDVTRTAGNTYTSISSTGTSFTGWNGGTSTDDNLTGITPIGFSFPYKGNTYTKFRLSTNGWLTLDTTQTSNVLSNGFTSTTKLFLAPLWEDLVAPGNPSGAAGLASSYKYQVSGTTPNRVLTAEWIGSEKFSYPGPNLNFQVKLYENGNIDFAYGTMEGFNGTSTTLYSITVGLSSNNGTGSTMADVMSQQVENTNYFSAISQNNLTSVQECNSTLSFTPGNYTGPNSYTAAPPVNDDVPGAIALTVNPVPCTSYCGTYFSSKAATASPQSSSCTTAPDDDVWFTFSAPISGQVKVTVLGSEGYDPVVSLYDNTLNAVGTFGCVNASGTGLSEALIATSVNPTTNYYVRVSHNGAGSGTSNGMFSICVSDNVPPPANNNICGATALTVDTACNATIGTTINATASPTNLGPTSTCNTPDDDLWYVFIPNANNNLLTVQSGAGFNAAMQIDTAKNNLCSDTLYQVACVNSTSAAGAETFSGPWIVGKPYYVRVYHAGVGAGTGNFTICVRTVPPTCVTVTTPAASASVPAAGITITWSASLNASGYDVYLSTNQVDVTSQNATALVSSNQPGLTYATGTLTTATTYYYKIVPRNSFGQRNNGCTTYDFNTNPPTCISTPTYPGNAASICSVNTPTTLSWPASPGATAYDVYFDAGTGPSATLVSSNQTGTTYTTASALGAGSYVWKVIPKNTNGASTGCSDFSFTILQSPTITSTPSTSTFCGAITTPVTLTASGTATSFIWSPTTGLYTNAAATTAYTGGTATTVYAKPTMTTVYTITGTNTIGCSSTTKDTITIAPTVTVAPTAKFPTLCAGGGTDTLYANGSIATTGYCAAVNQGGSLITNVSINTLSNNTSTNQPSALPYYSYYAPTGTTTTTLTAGSTYTVGVDLNGAGIVSVWIDFNKDGTLDATEWVQPYTNATTGTASITVPAGAQNGTTRMRVRSRNANLQNGSGDACLSMGSGETEDYDITITGGVGASGGLTYSWSPSSVLNSSTVANPEATITSSTTFTVTATSTAGCSATDTVRVNVGVPLVTTASAAYTAICAGTVDTIKSVTTGGGTPYSYSWSNGTSVVSTAAKFTITPTTTTNYTLTVTDACSSIATSSVTVTVNQKPTVSISPSGTTTNICANGSQTFTTTTNASIPAYQYQLNDVNIAGANGNTYTANVGGVYRVIVTNNATGCVDTSSRDTLVVNPLPKIFVTPATATIACGSGPVQLDAKTISPTVGLFSEDFNSGLGNFTQSIGATHTQGNFLIYPSGYTYSGTFTTSDASNFVMINSDSNGSASIQRLYLTSTSFATTGYDSVKLTMEDFYQLWSSGDSAIGVQASTDATTWTTVFDIKALGTHGSAGSFAKDTIKLPSAYSNQSNVYLRVQYASTFGYYLAINKINVIGQSLTPAAATWTEATDLYTNSSATTPYTMGNTAGTLYATPSSDIRYIATYNNGVCSDTGSVTITVTGSPTTLAGTSGATTRDTGTLIGSSITFRATGCGLIATITPSGGLPLSGNLMASVTRDNSVQSYLSLPYATRHYDIVPETNAASTTATVTLYFTQAEMNAVNSYIIASNLMYSVMPMPTGPTDAQGIASLRIKQYHGTGTAPSNYTGSTQTIKPTSVTWNSTNSWWAVTFPVNGFSGFYLTTGRFPTIALKAYLQGALNSGTTMDDNYQDYFGTGSGLLPATNPYGVPGGTYSQINASAGPVGAIVDWVKVEVRDSVNPSTILETRALLLKTNGSIVDSLGNAPYFSTQASKVMLAVWHRNHLAILSNPISAPSQDEAKTYDFTTSLSKASNPYFDPQQMVQKNGVWCMWAGDVNNPQDLFIDNSDFASTRAKFKLSPFDVYDLNDLNLDGFVDNLDFALQKQNFQANLYSTLSNY